MKGIPAKGTSFRFLASQILKSRSCWASRAEGMEEGWVWYLAFNEKERPQRLMEPGAQQHTAPWQLKGEHAASFHACLGVHPQQLTLSLCPDSVPVPSYCCGRSLPFLHKRRKVCHVVFFLRLSLLRGWEELSEQTFWLHPPAKHSMYWRGSHAPAVGSHRHFVTHIFKGFLCTSLSIPGNGTNRCVSLTQEMLQGLCF